MIDLYLDDARACPKGFVWAKNAAECIELLLGCDVRVLSLDYDLGWREPTGMDVVRFMILERKYPAVIYLHTSSSAGRAEMYQALYMNKPPHVRLFNYPMPDRVLRQIAEGHFQVENNGETALQ
ncbi:cyclic-phosphate processing receiver domain-containing protein [Paenibacillus sp. GYB003]|uniref:cyclic-phosphate processing receiver domain-containing protein n=1 Tax=Paenibacillus sp. GYB003 TaxID=2994392 RepID=UPI002F96E848